MEINKMNTINNIEDIRNSERYQEILKDIPEESRKEVDEAIAQLEEHLERAILLPLKKMLEMKKENEEKK